MEYGEISVSITGISPILMNRLDPESLKRTTRSTTKTYNVDVEARKKAYITEVNGEEQLYIPSRAIYSMILEASKGFRLGKIYMSQLLPGTIEIQPEEVLLGHCNYEVDVRPVNIKGARVLRSRAKIPEWKVSFIIRYHEALTDPCLQSLREILEQGGIQKGLLDFRPQHKGWFGKFQVDKFDITKEIV